VAYCLKITDIDPLTYDLLFERFLNPDRISLPDIDVDFEDTGKIIEWVTKKYGAEKVARIITYGTMATKSALADVARVQKVPLDEVNRLKKLVPDKFDDVIDPETGKTFGSSGKKPPKVKLKNCFKYIPELKEARYSSDPNVSTMCEYAEQLEDTNRQIGIHACGVIIGADDLTNFAPMCTVKDKDTGRDVLVTQYDGHVIESVGLIKMDFLGLITLTLIKTTIQNVKKSKGIDVDIDNIPLDDELTYKLFGDGRTVGVFQFESPGMQKYLRELKPTVITDLIAMNALYRPGPIGYIPNFIARKHGREEIKYDLPIMEKYLGDSYGVTVYQEQVMLLSRLLAGFTRGQSDSLRKAMGKKIFAMLEQLKPKFIEGAMKNPNIRDGLTEEMSDEQLKETLEKIWKDWEAFASYAFNKSHAACYAWVAYQTGYLKAHYPAEYLAANLTISKDTITEVQKFMEECKVMGIKVKGPDVNESMLDFTVNDKGEILYGMGGVKGVGEGPVEAIIKAREEGGPFKTIFDFFERVNLQTCNRKAIESLALAGAFENIEGITREQFFAPANSKGQMGSEVLVQYGNSFQQDKNKNNESLFGDMFGNVEIAKPVLPRVVPWSDLDRLNKEKEVVGIYLSSHPLDMYRFEMKYVMNTPIADLRQENLPNLVGRNFITGGIVTGLRNGLSKRGEPFLIATVEDMEGQGEIGLFGKDYASFANFFTQNAYVCVMGTVAKSTYNDQIRRSYTKIMYMPDLLTQNRFKSLTLSMDSDMVDDQIIGELSKSLIENKSGRATSDSDNGRNMVPISFVINDSKSKHQIHLFSRTHSVELGPDIMRFVESNPGIEMSLQ